MRSNFFLPLQKSSHSFVRTLYPAHTEFMSALVSPSLLSASSILHSVRCGDDSVLENQLPLFDYPIPEYQTNRTVIAESIPRSYALQLSLFGNAEQNDSSSIHSSILPAPTAQSTQQAQQLVSATLSNTHSSETSQNLAMKQRPRIRRDTETVYHSPIQQSDAPTSLDDSIHTQGSVPTDRSPASEDSLSGHIEHFDEIDALALQEITVHELPPDVLEEMQALGNELPEELREQLFAPPLAPVSTTPPGKKVKPLSRRTLLRRVATEIGVATWFDEEREAWMWEDELSGKTAFQAHRNEEKALEEALTEVIQNSYPYLSEHDVEMILADPENCNTIIQQAKTASMIKKSSLL